jgi:hypothetical protein
MVTIQEIKRQPDRAAENTDAAVPHLPTDMREAPTERLCPLNPCPRCGNVRPLTHRVRSDLLDQTVCEACAAEVPLVSKGVGALTVERIIPIGKSSAAPAATRF